MKPLQSSTLFLGRRCSLIPEYRYLLSSAWPLATFLRLSHDILFVNNNFSYFKFKNYSPAEGGTVTAVIAVHGREAAGASGSSPVAFPKASAHSAVQ